MRQKTKVKWLQESDCNSNFYHIVVNWIEKIQSKIKGVSVEGVSCKEPEQVKNEVKNFLAKRFSEVKWRRPTFEGVNFEKISSQQCGSLEVVFQELKVKEAIWKCASLKSPARMVWTFNSIKKFWVICKGEILHFLSDFQANGIFPKGTNSSLVALIPKCDNPMGLEEYRPISLVSSLYKIVAKVLVRRLKSVLNGVIDQS